MFTRREKVPSMCAYMEVWIEEACLEGVEHEGRAVSEANNDSLNLTDEILSIAAGTLS